MSIRLIPTLFFSALVAVSLSLAPQAQAQEPAPPMAEPTTPDVSDEELRAFTQAYIEVQQIGEEHQAALANVQNAEEAQALQEQAQVAMTEAVQAQGLAPEEYTGIVEVLNDDDLLRLRFSEMLVELTEPEEARF